MRCNCLHAGKLSKVINRLGDMKRIQMGYGSAASERVVHKSQGCWFDPQLCLATCQRVSEELKTLKSQAATP